MKTEKVYYNPICNEFAVIPSGWYHIWMFEDDWNHVISLGEL